MPESTPFGDILEAADKLPVEDQEELVSILRNRVRERRRAELLKDLEDSEREFAEGKVRPATVDEIMRDILS
jgi:hypothetical protein